MSVVLAGVLAQAQGAGLRVEHDPPACLRADAFPRLVACLVPRHAKATVRLFFRAEGEVFEYSTLLRADAPCYSALLPRPSPSTSRVVYRFEATGTAADEASTAEHRVAVVGAEGVCPGKVAPVAARGAKDQASWKGPAGAPRTPPGFEGTEARGALAGEPSSTRAPNPPPRPVPARPVPLPPGPPAGAAPTLDPKANEAGGHGVRNTLIVGAGVAAAGGAVAASHSGRGSSGPPATTGTGLPATGVSGVYVGIETVNYPGGCVGIDDVVLNLRESGGSLSGVLSFTVRSCPCCSMSRGADLVNGSLSGTTVGLATPSGFSYSGTFAGNRLAGSLAAPGGIAGTWSVDKR